MATFDAAQRDKLAAEGVAMSDGGYPIRNATDLENAYKDWVRTGRPQAVAAHIAARAKALGLPDPISSKGDEVDAARRLIARKQQPTR